MSDLVKIDPKEFGIQESKAKEIASQFKPMLEKMEELEDEFNEVMQMPIEDDKTAEKAKEVRLKYVKVRTGTANIHKEQKAFYLAGGRFVDGWKNAQVFASQGKEEKLKAIEEHKKRLEAERLEKLQNERVEALSNFVEDAHERDLSSMDSDVWQAYLSTKKKEYEDRIKAEQKAEKERIEKEKAEEEERKRIREENERLRKEAEAEKARQAKLDAERKAKEEKERKAREAEEKAKREAHEAEIKKERDQRAKIEAKLKAKAEAEEKSKREDEAKKQAELSKGDKDKFKDFVTELSSLKTKYDFKSKEFKKKYNDATQLIDKILNHIN